VFKKLDYPIAPLVLALVLGDKTEVAFRQSLIMGNGSLAVFWSNSLVATFTTAALLLAAWPIVLRLSGADRHERPEAA
jgi:TctA family transporter